MTVAKRLLNWYQQHGRHDLQWQRRVVSTLDNLEQFSRACEQ